MGFDSTFERAAARLLASIATSTTSRRTVLTIGAAGALALGGGHWPAAAAPAATEADDFTLLLDRWARILVGTEQALTDSAYRTSVQAQDRGAQNQLAKIKVTAGRTTPWDDLPLGEAVAPSSSVTGVANRLRSIALGYATEASALYRDGQAAAACAAGIRILCDAVFHPGQNEYDNWFDWEIGTPKSLGDTCVLLGTALPAETLNAALSAIDFFVPDPTRMLRNTLFSTGANRVDLCRAVAVRGALGRDPEPLALASRSLAGVLDPVLIGDGFHPDGSFIMHTFVAYPGTYGEVLVKGMTELMRLLAGTTWDVGQVERDRTLAAVQDTFVPFLHGGLMVDSVRGRAISRTAARDADDGFLLAVDLVNLAAALPRSAADEAMRLRSLAKGWLRRNTWRPLSARQPVQIATVAPVLADDSLPEAPEPVGHFSFPDMERVVHRRTGWTMSLAMNSDRVARYEFMNQENARGWHTGDGMLQLHLDTDLFHYTDDYWPTVDAKRLPGTTVDTAPLAVGAGGDNDHVPLTGTRWSGGVRLGAIGLAGLQLTAVDSPLHARKSWFFLDDAVLCAGSGITASADRKVETIVENRRVDAATGTFTVDGQPQPSTPSPAGRYRNVRWAHIAGVGGYLFLRRPKDAPGHPDGGGPDGGGPVLSALCEDRTGSWRDLNGGGPTAPITRRYLTLWHDHGSNPEDAWYGFLQLPAATFASTAAHAAYPGVEIVALTRDVHAFRTTPGRPELTAVNFFTPGTAAGVTADAPCSVLLRRVPAAGATGRAAVGGAVGGSGDGDTLTVAVADPSRTAPVVIVEIDSPGYASVVAATEGVTVLATAGRAQLLIETGARHGATLTATLGRGRPPGRRTVHLLPPVADATVGAGSHADDSDGTGPVLTVRTAEQVGDTRRSHLRFDLTGVSGPVQRAVLWVYGGIPNDPSTREDDMMQTVLNVHGPSSSDWSESTLTWNNAPSPGPALSSGTATDYPDWIAFEVTQAVRQRPGSSLALVIAQDAPGHEVRLNSRESGRFTPLLEVVTDP